MRSAVRLFRGSVHLFMSEYEDARNASWRMCPIHERYSSAFTAKGGHGRASCMGLAATRRSVAYISWLQLLTWLNVILFRSSKGTRSRSGGTRFVFLVRGGRFVSGKHGNRTLLASLILV